MFLSSFLEVVPYWKDLGNLKILVGSYVLQRCANSFCSTHHVKCVHPEGESIMNCFMMQMSFLGRVQDDSKNRILNLEIGVWLVVYLRGIPRNIKDPIYPPTQSLWWNGVDYGSALKSQIIPFLHGLTPTSQASRFSLVHHFLQFPMVIQAHCLSCYSSFVCSRCYLQIPI